MYHKSSVRIGMCGTFFRSKKPHKYCEKPGLMLNLLGVLYLNVCGQELELEKFITHEIPFSEINKAFEYMLKGDGLRCIIRMDG